MLLVQKMAVSISTLKRSGVLTPQWTNLTWNPWLFMK
ncbi:hypothetical protein NC651_030494 [Populus alba x Populus x berolinensis]|nr:hypothetical protein NC651_030494 [Populus alba x Populus x berolinensis]